MNSTNIWKQIGEWLSTYSAIYNWLYFNTITYEAGAFSFNSVPTSRNLVEYIDGSKEVELIFAIDMVRDYDSEQSDTNYDAVNECENFAVWLEEQDNLENYPDLGEAITVTGVEVLDNVPIVSVNEEQTLSKYQFQVKINYTESGE